MFVCLSTQTFAQKRIAKRVALTGKVGLNPTSNHFTNIVGGLTVDYFFGNNGNLFLDLDFAQDHLKNKYGTETTYIPQNTLSATLGYGHNIATKKWFMFNIYSGIYVNYYLYGEDLQLDTKTIGTGLSFQPQFEFGVSKKVSLLLTPDVRWDFLEMSKVRVYTTLGIKIYL